MRLVMHSYSFRAYPLEHVFAAAQRFGWIAVELASCHFDAGHAQRDITAAVRLAEQHGVKVHCVGYYGDFVAQDEAVRQRSIRSVKGVIDACAANGIGLVNGFGGWLTNGSDDWRNCGSAIARDWHYELAANAYRMVSSHAGEQGVRIGIEVHPNTIHDTVSSTVRLLRLVDSEFVFVTPDPGNSFVISEADRDPEVLNQLNGKLSYFHLKNCRILDSGRADFNTDTAQGVIDNYRWLAKLAQLHIPAVCVEYCGDGDPHPPIATAAEYIRSCLSLAAVTGTAPMPVSPGIPAGTRGEESQ